MIKAGVRFIVIPMLLIALVVVGGVAAVKVNTVDPATAAGASTTAGAAPVLVIEKSHVMKLASSSVMMIMGAGFTPNQEVRLVISQKDGSLSDIGTQLEPQEIKANDFGVWGVKWTTGAFTHSALATAEMYVLYATDVNYNILAAAPFGYYNDKEEYAKWPSWARAIIAAPAPPAAK